MLVADNVIVAILTLATIVTGIYGSHSIFHWSGRSMQLMHMLGHYHQWLGYAMIPFMVGHILLNIQSFKMMVQAVKKRVVRPKVSITEE